MIKVNLLDSVTDRAKGVAAVEDRVASPRTQSVLLGVVITVLLALGMSYDFVSAKSEHSSAEVELAKQQEIKNQMQLVNKEQADLEKKTAEVQARINAIQTLRAAQQGPGNVLHEVKDRIDWIPGLYLESVEQKGNDLIIKGGSPNETSVARFGQSLEFSAGLFSNLSIETERRGVEAPKGTVAVVGTDLAIEKPEIVNFTVKCAYAPHPAQAQQQSASNPAAPANQIAKK
jgi:Tfp pilus assembly protein PilN